MRRIYISKSNEEQLYKDFTNEAERKNRNKLFSATMWVLFIFSAIAFFYGLVKILMGGYFLLDQYGPELLSGIVTTSMGLLFPLIIAACVYSFFDMLYANGESWGEYRGSRKIIELLVNNKLTDYITDIKDDGKIEPKPRSFTPEEIEAFLKQRR